MEKFLTVEVKTEMEDIEEINQLQGVGDFHSVFSTEHFHESVLGIIQKEYVKVEPTYASEDYGASEISNIKLEDLGNGVKPEEAELHTIPELSTTLKANGKKLDTKQFKCPECDYTAKHKPTLKQHILVKHSTNQLNKHRCNNCLFETPYLGNLNKHIAMTHALAQKIKMYKCDKCEFESKHKYSVKSHKLNKHTVRDVNMKTEMFKCEKCTYETPYKHSLKVHMVLVHTDRSELELFRCDDCGFETKDKRNLRSHIERKHLNIEKPRTVSCGQCSFITSSNSYLRKHMIVHWNPSESELYRCEQCPFTTKYKRGLMRHIHNRHTMSDNTDIVIYYCDKCPFMTARKDGIKRHAEVHIEKERFQCYNCGFTAKYKHHLKNHIVAKHMSV